MSIDTTSSAATAYCITALGNVQPSAICNGNSAARSAVRSTSGISGDSAR